MSAIWAKFNKNERNVSFGAAIVLIAWVVGLVGYGGFDVEGDPGPGGDGHHRVLVVSSGRERRAADGG